MPDSSAVDDDRMLHTMASCIATLHDFIADRNFLVYRVCHMETRHVIRYKERKLNTSDPSDGSHHALYIAKINQTR